MIWHPLALTILIFDALSGILAIAILIRLVRALPGWNPVSPDRLQLTRERSLELILFQGRCLFVLQLLTTGLLVLGISNLWTAIIPGAMCGTGVLQAMGAAGIQTLTFRFVALLLLAAWQAAAGICRRSASMTLWPLMGRTLIPVLPVIALATVAWGQSLAAITPGAAVHCCALVYSSAGASLPAETATAISGHRWVLGAVTGALVLAALGMVLRRKPPSTGVTLPMAITAGTLAWAAVATVAIRDGVAPYVYEVLAHRCIWCLFLTDHWGIGFLLFGAVLLMAMEQLAALTVYAVARSDKAATPAARARLRLAYGRTTAAAIIFAIAASTPPITWRVTFGQWLY